MTPKTQHVWSLKRTIWLAKIWLNLRTHFCMFKQPKHHINMATMMLLLPTEAIVDEEMNTYGLMLFHLMLYHWTYIIQDIFIYTSRHIIVNTDNEDRDRKILNGKGSLGHWHSVNYSLAIMLFTFLRKIGSAWDVNRTNYSKGSLIEFFNF